MGLGRVVQFFLIAIAFFYQIAGVASNQGYTAQEHELIKRVQISIAAAEQGISKLKPEILVMEGMSSNKVRHFLNNLCSAGNTSYLEIGCWKGSTWISALYGNQESIVQAVGIDNWSEFDGPREEFQRNCSNFLPQSYPYSFYSVDCFSLALDQVFERLVNVYFYDGEHSAWSQEKAFTYYNDVLDSAFIAVVDDWNWESAREGTRIAFNKLDYEILFEQVLPAAFCGDVNQWWNGLYVAVVRKP